MLLLLLLLPLPPAGIAARSDRSELCRRPGLLEGRATPRDLADNIVNKVYAPAPPSALPPRVGVSNVFERVYTHVYQLAATTPPTAPR